MARYQETIDILIDDVRYERVYFDHETELEIPYRNIGFHKRNALQEKPGKGRALHKKWADICAIKSGKVKVIIEEERKATETKVGSDINIIKNCHYNWVDGNIYPFDDECLLFILLNKNIHGIPERIYDNMGSLNKVIICEKGKFKDYYFQVIK